MRLSRVISIPSILLACFIILIFGARVLLFGPVQNAAQNPQENSSQNQNVTNLNPTDPQETRIPTYDDNIGLAILEKSPFSPTRTKFVRSITPPPRQAQPRAVAAPAPPPPPKTGRLLGILGRGENQRAIIAIDGDPAPLEVRLGENSPLGKIIRIERSKIILEKDNKTIELSMF